MLARRNLYARWANSLAGKFGDKGLQAAIGGEFEAFGIVQLEMLKHYGLADGQFLVDVGCGSGRLAIPLSRSLDVRYLGLDIVPALVNHARQRTARPSFRFEVIDRLRIPLGDGVCDMACFFSVFTHLAHHQTYLYLEDAKRVLKRGATIVFSFLEFAMDFHWDVFEATVANERTGGAHPLNCFIERNAIVAWARHLELSIVEFQDGSTPFVKLPRPLMLESGAVMQEYGNLGQSICVLRT